jgi:mRNA interferase MazF
MTAKTRPCLILSVPPDPRDRVLVTVVPRTTSVQGTRFEVDVPARYLHPGGAFDAQQVATVGRVRLIRRLGDLDPAGLAAVEDAVRRWLGL